jgi:hypothetical protein
MHHIENDISTIVATSSTVIGYLSFQLPAQSPLSLSNQDLDCVPLRFNWRPVMTRRPILRGHHLTSQLDHLHHHTGSKKKVVCFESLAIHLQCIEPLVGPTERCMHA